ncbi:hypothetical protein [Hungatella hathewayi]|mgnify:CR=1 FL=1|uniref:hypothetical protein n=1 Tax=Hungatella hathewayi TaxID=154046 RepID=UPI0003377DDE|nr:hypothetical protein [Hungatella hathewayi]CCZ61226.1 putative uncharacterized protein [Hungatella hathewayi CAG:224]
MRWENRKFHLTLAGEYFYRQAAILLEEAERIRQDTIRIARQKVQKLRGGYLKSYGGYELQHAAAAFSELFPDIELHIVNGIYEELYDALRFGEAYLVFKDHRCAFSDLYENFFGFYGIYLHQGGQSPLSQLKSVTIEELRRIMAAIFYLW